MSTVIYSPEDSALYADTAYFQNGTLASTSEIRFVSRESKREPGLKSIYAVGTHMRAYASLMKHLEPSEITEPLPLIILENNNAASLTEDLYLYEPRAADHGFLAIGTGATLAYAFNHTGYSPEQVMSAVRDLDPWTAGRIVKAFWQDNEMQIEEVG